MASTLVVLASLLSARSWHGQHAGGRLGTDGHDAEPLVRDRPEPDPRGDDRIRIRHGRCRRPIAQAQATDFPGRAKAWADEIEHARPDLIGLQEAALWRTQTPADFSPTPNATTVQADLVGLLLAELRSRGLKYEVVIAQTGYDIEAPGLFPTGFVDVRLTQREVILARKSPGLKLTNAQGGQYAAIVTVPTIIGVPVSLPWAWASVDATRSGHSFRFATTHLDPISGVAQQAQADEFLAGPGSTTLPIVWVGDFNSDAEATVITGVPSATATYGSIIASGFSDAWKAKPPVRSRLHLLPGDGPPEPDVDADRAR